MTVPILGIGKAALDAAGNMEQVTIAMSHFMGSAEKANDFLKQLMSFASQTPFRVQEITPAHKRCSPCTSPDKT